MFAPALFIVDANVLIDYADSDRTVLALVSRHLGTVHVPEDIVDEVQQMSRSDYDALGLRIVSPSNAQYTQAGQPLPGLSFVDRLCFIMARDAGWTCVSNDAPLRKACVSSKVPVLWGLEPMLLLVDGGHLSPDVAVGVAQAIRSANPRYITAAVVEAFERKLTSRKRPPRK